MRLSRFIWQNFARLTRHFSCFLCHAYPAYHTYKALESTSGSLQQKWVTVWIVQAPLLIAERLPLPISSLPGYYSAKFLFLLWLTLDRFNGANRIYDRLVLPLLAKYETQIDTQLADAKQSTVEWSKKSSARGFEKLKNLVAYLCVQIAIVMARSMRLSLAQNKPSSSSSESKPQMRITEQADDEVNANSSVNTQPSQVPLLMPPASPTEPASLVAAAASSRIFSTPMINSMREAFESSVEEQSQAFMDRLLHSHEVPAENGSQNEEDSENTHALKVSESHAMHSAQKHPHVLGQEQLSRRGVLADATDQAVNAVVRH